MDFPVVWSPEAIEDLDSIAEYIGRDSDFYARAVVTKVLNVTRAIPDFP
jgi:toxin ParE1/3/4